MPENRKPYVVGIVGGSASGKSSFLRDLCGRLPEGTCSALSQDNYYRLLEEQERDSHGQPNFDLPSAFHRDHFFTDLCALIRGETITRTEYTYNHRRRQGAVLTISPAHVILVEGLFLFYYAEIRSLLDLRVFVDAKEEICKARRLKRDLLDRGYPAEDVEYKWSVHVLPALRQFILPQRDDAHIIVANHESYEKGLEVVADHVLAKLAGERAAYPNTAAPGFLAPGVR